MNNGCIGRISINLKVKRNLKKVNAKLLSNLDFTQKLERRLNDTTLLRDERLRNCL